MRAANEDEGTALTHQREQYLQATPLSSSRVMALSGNSETLKGCENTQRGGGKGEVNTC